jgi:regulator of protease activity HflC (stomatin/prohibitin superfamily)
MFNNNRQSVSTPPEPKQNVWFVPLLVVLVFAYWLFAWAMERIDLAGEGATGLQTAVAFVRELFHWRVWRHFAPVIVGWYLAYMAAVSLVQTLYDLPDKAAARQFLSQLSMGSNMVSVGRAIILRSQDLEEIRPQVPILRVGGPGLVSIRAGDVAVTERNGRFFRVLGPGKHRLARFEYVHAVLDLRQQEQRIEELKLVTRDGISVTADVTLTYRISTGGEPATRVKPFPYDEEAIKRVAFDQTVMADKMVSTWESIPVNTTRSTLTNMISKYGLDEILQPTDMAVEPHLVLRNELERRVRLALLDRGIELTGLHIGRLQFPPPVTEQYIKYWQTKWEIQATISKIDGEARAQEEIEIARAEAEVTMIQAIAEGVRRAQQEGRTGTMREIVALRLIESLEKVAKQSQNYQPLPYGLMPSLNQMRYELLPERTLTEDSEES